MNILRRDTRFSMVFAILLALVAGSCASYYQKNLRFQQHVYEGELSKAKSLLDKEAGSVKDKNKLLYLMNQGWVSWMLGKNQESNQYLEQADYMIEDYRKRFGYEVATLVTNPGIKPYKAEDFEKVMVNYIKAINYLEMKQFEEALVEARRINLKLQEINDQYKEHKNRYSDDAFAHVIMGLIYEASYDYNNAFIAYRNAYNVYKEDYKQNFGMDAPRQLKLDILRTAYLNRFMEELAYFEKEFGIKYDHSPKKGGEVVFIWHNGLGPVKEEWGISFVKTSSEAGVVVFHNEELGLTFPFYIGDKPEEEKSAFAQLNVLRVAFPKYMERKPVYNQAKIKVNDSTHALELAQDVNAIAFKTLHDRMVREIANSLLRLASKKALEQAVREQNQDVGAAVGILNALTEKADTRNWQTLPYAIHYTRIPVDTGKHTLHLKLSGNDDSRQHNLEVNISKGETEFRVFHTLESQMPQSVPY